MVTHFTDVQNIEEQIRKLRDAKRKYEDAARVLKHQRDQLPASWKGDAGRVFHGKWENLTNLVLKHNEAIDAAIEVLEKRLETAQGFDDGMSGYINSVLSRR